MIKTFFLLAILFFSVNNFAAVSHQNDLALLNSIIDDFQQAIIKKDKALFMTLILNNDIPWIGVMDDTSIALIKKKYPSAPIEKIMKDTPEHFIDGIINQEPQSRELFKNIEIDHDDKIASIFFDYEFYKSNQLQNFGKESWQLIYTESGWKISAVIYSATINIK